MTELAGAGRIRPYPKGIHPSHAHAHASPIHPLSIIFSRRRPGADVGFFPGFLHGQARPANNNNNPIPLPRPSQLRWDENPLHSSSRPAALKSPPRPRPSPATVELQKPNPSLSLALSLSPSTQLLSCSLAHLARPDVVPALVNLSFLAWGLACMHASCLGLGFSSSIDSRSANTKQGLPVPFSSSLRPSRIA